MKIESTGRTTPLLRSIERIMHEEDGRIDADAVTLDLDERRKEREERRAPTQDERTPESEAHEVGSDESQKKAPLSVVA